MLITMEQAALVRRGSIALVFGVLLLGRAAVPPGASASLGCGPDAASDLYDADGDGRGCYAELNIDGTDPFLFDTDGDGIGDGDEGYLYGTSSLDFDTDDDGWSDGEEVFSIHTNPLVANQSRGNDMAGATDTDGDGLSDADEVAIHGTNPDVFDTDGDGYSDGREIAFGMNPLVADLFGP